MPSTSDTRASNEALRDEGRIHSDEPRGAAGDDPEEAGKHELHHPGAADEAAAAGGREGGEGWVDARITGKARAVPLVRFHPSLIPEGLD